MFNRFAIFDAYYMFASLYHGGQNSKEYAYFGRLDKLGYKPGLGASSQNPDRLTEDAREVFDRLVEKHEAPQKAKISDIPSRIAKLFEKLGIPTEWLDEWVECSHCGKIVRCLPDSMSWTPYYTMGEGELWRHECEPEETNEEPDEES